MVETALFGFLFNVLWQTSLFAAGVWCVIRILKIKNAAMRCTLWSSAFFLAVTVPLTSLSFQTRPAAEIITPTLVGTDVGAVQKAGPVQADAVTPFFAGQVLQVALEIAAVTALIVWLLGAAWKVFALARENLAITRLRRESTPVKQFGEQDLPFSKASVRSHQHLQVPVATGLFRPMIILPKAIADQVDSPCARSALAHEYAHVRRGDLIAAFFESIALAIFWWNPVLRRIRRKIAESREMACDDQAVSYLADRKAYVRSLAAYAEYALQAKNHIGDQTMLAAVTDRSSLKHRIGRIVSADYGRSLRKSTARAVIAGAAISMVSVCAALAAPRAVIEVGADSPRVQYEQPAAASRAEELGRLLVEAIADRNWSGADAQIDAGADVNTVLYRDGTPLIAAVNVGSERYVSKLIALGADVDVVVPFDETALISAVRHGDRAIVRLLIDAGADVNKATTTENGVLRSPLGEAIRLNLGAIERDLRTAGAK